MQGSIIIHETSAEKLVALAESIDALENFDHIALDVLLTLDFETMVGGSKIPWMTGEPVVYYEAAGLAVVRLSPAGLSFVLDNPRKLDDEQSRDMDTLRAFIKKHGPDNIYELATF